MDDPVRPHRGGGVRGAIDHDRFAQQRQSPLSHRQPKGPTVSRDDPATLRRRIDSQASTQSAPRRTGCAARSPRSSRPRAWRAALRKANIPARRSANGTAGPMRPTLRARRGACRSLRSAADGSTATRSGRGDRDTQEGRGGRPFPTRRGGRSGRGGRPWARARLGRVGEARAHRAQRLNGRRGSPRRTRQARRSSPQGVARCDAAARRRGAAQAAHGGGPARAHTCGSVL
eukprot:gene6325-biopygen5829